MKTRIRFVKTGSLKFIGHLDCMRFFQKALRRAGLDVKYTKGYSPHPVMSFASPLGVGITSDGEYVDVEFNSLPTEDSDEFARYMNRFMSDELFVTGLEIMPDNFKNSMSLLTAADYMIVEKEPGALPPELAGQWRAFMEQPRILIVKKSKSSEKEMDVKPYILAEGLSLEEFSEKTGEQYGAIHCPYEGRAVFLQLRSGSEINIKPEPVAQAFAQAAGWRWEPCACQVHRLQMHFK